MFLNYPDDETMSLDQDYQIGKHFKKFPSDYFNNPKLSFWLLGKDLKNIPLKPT